MSLRHAEQRPELALGALALDELADLAADRAEHLEQALVGLADRAAEELQHAEARCRPARSGSPMAPCSPSRAATLARGKLESCVTSAIHAGRALSQTRPGRPTPRRNTAPRVAASNSDTTIEARCQVSRQRIDVAGEVDRPHRSVVAVQDLSQHAQDPRRGFGQRGRLGERAGGDDLRVQPADRVGLRRGWSSAPPFVRARCYTRVRRRLRPTRPPRPSTRLVAR